MTLLFPECNFYTIANFQCPRSLLSPLIITTSPIWMSASLSLWFRLCRSLRDTSHLQWHLFHFASLHRNTYFGHFLKTSHSSSDVTTWSVGNTTSHPNSIIFGVKGWCAISSSMYIRGLLLKLTSITSNTSTSSAYLRCTFPTVM